MVTKKYCDDLKKEMANKSVKSLVDDFNAQVGKEIYTSAHDIYVTMIVQTLIAKNVDVSAVYDGFLIYDDKPIKLNREKNKIKFV